MKEEKKIECAICHNHFEYGRMYEYRGFLNCDACFDELQAKVDNRRQEVIEEQNHKTAVFKGLDMSNSTIGKSNREILERNIEIAKKPSKRVNDYENGIL